MAIRCVYCGENDLECPSGIYKGSDPNEPYKCKHCGVFCTALEVSRSAEIEHPKNTYLGINHAVAAPIVSNLSEDEILSSAEEQMKNNQWDQALETLLKKGYPLAQTAEFMIYRSICQTAILFADTASDRKSRALQVKLMLNNLSCLDYFAPFDKDEVYHLLTRIFKALMLLADTPFKHASKSAAMLTKRHLAMILSAYADLMEMETIGNSEKLATEYKKMSLLLLHKCLALSKEKRGRFFPRVEKQLQLPTGERRQINAKIKNLNEQIRQAEPDFPAVPPPPMPLVIPKFLVTACKFTLNICSVGLFLYCLVSLFTHGLFIKGDFVFGISLETAAAFTGFIIALIINAIISYVFELDNYRWK